MRALPLSAALLTLALLSACSSYRVTSDYDVTASFGRYKTFDHYISKKGTGGTTSLMDKRVRVAVERELVGRGFVLETKADPDFLITYYPIVRERKYRTTTQVGLGWGHRPLYGRVGTRMSQVHRYKEGTIVLEIVDYRTNQLVWQGAAAGALGDQDSPEAAEEVIARAVKDILERFPPR
jgi:hypothetical protein